MRKRMRSCSGTSSLPHGHALLELHGAAYRVDDARELAQGPVADPVDDTAVMLGDERVDELRAMRLEPGDRRSSSCSISRANSPPRPPQGRRRACGPPERRPRPSPPGSPRTPNSRRSAIGRQPWSQMSSRSWYDALRTLSPVGACRRQGVVARQVAVLTWLADEKAENPGSSTATSRSERHEAAFRCDQWARPGAGIRTNTSHVPLVSPGTRLVASDSKATKRPSAESAGRVAVQHRPGRRPARRSPAGSCRVRRSRTNTSSAPLVSPGTRLVASE